MPRRRPAQLRVDYRRLEPERRGGSRRGLARGSGKLAAAIARLERERLWSGAVIEALRWWSKVAHRPGLAVSGGCGCPMCIPFYVNDERAVLELALHVLPLRSARELRALVEPLDELYLAGTWPDPLAPAHYQWWARRCWG